MTIKNRDALKSYFVKNAIPTEGNFIDLIDSQLNQAPDGDGVFKPAGEPFSVVAAPGDQKRVLRLYSLPSAANPDWIVSLNPAQDPADAAHTSKPGFGITDGAGKLRLFIDAGTGQVGVGTNSPQFALDVAGGVRASSGLSVQGMVDVTTTTQTWGTWLEAIRFSRPEHSAITHPGGKLLFGMHSDRNFYFADTNAGVYLATISPVNGGRLGIGTNGAPAYPLHVKSSTGDWQARFENPSSNSNVYLSHGGGYGMHVRTDTASTTNYLLQLYNGSQGNSLFYVSTAGNVGIGSGVTPSTFKLEVHGYTYFTDPGGKFNSHIPFTDNNAYITGNNVILRGGEPNGYNAILTATANPSSVTITGNLGTHGFAPNSQLPPGWGGGLNTWDVVAHGTVWSVHPYQNGNFDLAERFAHHEDGLEPGDVLAVDPRSPERLVKSRAAQQDDLVGVFSEQPGYILGAQWEAPDAGVPLALAGRVPVKVNLEGGPIRIGDYLTSSSQPGVAMRTIQSGRVIGLAMQAFDGTSGTEGKVVVFVNPHWFGGR